MKASAGIAPSLGNRDKPRTNLAAEGAIPLALHRTLRNYGTRVTPAAEERTSPQLGAADAPTPATRRTCTVRLESLTYASENSSIPTCSVTTAPNSVWALAS